MGILDAFNTDDGRQGLALLAAAAPTMEPMNLAGRIALAGKSYQGMKQDELKDAFVKSQIAENSSQAAMRQQQLMLAQRKMDMQNALLGYGPQAQQAPEAPAGGMQAPTGMTNLPMTGAPGVPSQLGTAPAGQAMPTPLGAQQPLTLEGLSKQYGIPVESLKFDLVNNEGKGIAEMVYKRGTPNWQNVNGNLVDTNAQGFKGGLQAGMSSSANGQVTAWQPDGQGGLVVGAPRGALETYGAYKAVENGQTPKEVYDDKKGQKVFRTVQDVIDASKGAGQWMGQEPKGNYTGDPQQVLSQINDIKDPTYRAEAMRAFQNQMSGGAAPSGPMAAEPSMKDANTAAAEKTQLEAQGKDVAETRKSIMTAGFSAPSTISKYQQIGKLLDGVDGGTLTATGTHLASTMNSLGIKIDKNLPNKEAAAALGNQMALELRSPANGAGMPGAMSDQDRNYLVSMIPNASQSAQGRKQLIDAQIAIAKRNQDVATFARNYEKKHGKLDNGFFDQMQAYSNENPLFGNK